jgi:hypothetical protein
MTGTGTSINKLITMKKLLILAIAIGTGAILFCSFRSGNIKSPGKNTKMFDTLILPDSYKNRKFLNDPDATSDPASIPGNLLRYTASAPDGGEIATLKAIIKGDKPAAEQKLTGAAVYKGQVLPESSLNGSSLINGLKAEKGQVIDMEIRDDATYAVPDGQIDTAAIKKALQSVSAGDRNNLFYITSATLSIITYKVHAAPTIMDKVDKVKAVKLDTAKNGIYYKVKPSKNPAPYSSGASDTKSFTEKTLSVQVIPVNDIMGSASAKK